jgi:hypothetical protein
LHFNAPACYTHLDDARLILKPGDQRRIRPVRGEALPHYDFTNYRNPTDASAAREAGDGERFYQLKIDGEVILSVYGVTKS